MNGLSSLANTSTVANQFYCDLTRNHSLPSCLSLSQFGNSPLDQLCPTQNCLEACQDLERLYEVVPSGLQVPAGKYGFADNASEFVTLYGLCAGYPTISQVLNDDTLPADQVDLVKPYFPSTAKSDLQSLANAVTQCLSDTCAKAVDGSNCTAKCSPAQLLLNSTTPSLAGAQACFEQLCHSSLGLPFGNQDVVGPGVTISYIIQSVLVLLSWLGLTVASIISYKWPHRSESSDKAMDVFLESLDGFLKAQCYFSIPIATATLLTDVFHLDPLNGYGFLPVAINGFLAQTFTLLQLHRNKRFSWYISTLVFTSWLLSTIILWAIIKYLTARPIGTQDFEFRSLSQINSCGGSSALALSLKLVDLSGWSFGQIIAIVVWLPVLADYLYLQFKASAPAAKRLYLRHRNPTSGNQNQAQDQQYLLHGTYTTGKPQTQHKNHTYQRLSDDVSYPSQSQPQNQQPRMDPSYDPANDDDLCNSPASEAQIDGFGLRPLTGVSERTGENERAEEKGDMAETGFK